MTKHPIINVLVTGLGPYPGGGGTIDPNISHVLTTLLPSHLAPNTTLNPSSNHIKIVTLGYPIKTEYACIRDFCRALHRPKSTLPQHYNEAEHLLRNIDTNNLDLVIHLGEARGWQFMSIERLAFKEGFTSSWWGIPFTQPYYTIPDNKGQTIEDLGPCPWDSLPMGLESALDIDSVAEGANAVLQNKARFAPGTFVPASATVDMRPLKSATEADDLIFAKFLDPRLGATGVEAWLPRSDVETAGWHDELLHRPIEIKPHREGGFYCCGFTNYESLANCYVNHRPANVLFCHVPGFEDEKSLAWQKDGVLAVIVSAVNDIVRRRG